MKSNNRIMQPLANRIINGRVVIIDFNHGFMPVMYMMRKFEAFKHSRPEVLLGTIGELVLQGLKKQRSSGSSQSILETIITIFRDGVRSIQNSLPFTSQDVFRPWRNAIQFLPQGGDALVLIDEIDGLMEAWMHAFGSRVEQDELIWDMWKAIVQLRDDSLGERFHIVIVGRHPHFFLRARNVTGGASPSMLTSIFLPPLKQEHLEATIQKTTVEVQDKPDSDGRKMALLDILEITCGLHDLTSFAKVLLRYTGGIPRCVVQSISEILTWRHCLRTPEAMDTALRNAISRQRQNDINPLSSILSSDKEALEASADLFLSFTMAAQSGIALPPDSNVEFRGKLHTLADLAALLNVWLDPVEEDKEQPNSSSNLVRIVVPYYSAYMFQQKYTDILDHLKFDSRLGLSLHVAGPGVVGEFFEFVVSRALVFSLLRTFSKHSYNASSSSLPLIWKDVLSGIFNDTRLADIAIPARMHGGGISKPMIGFSASSTITSVKGNISSLAPHEWMLTKNKVRPSAGNALEAINTAISRHGIGNDELAILHVPPLSEAYDTLLLQPFESSIVLKYKCVEVLKAHMIRDEILKTARVVPEGYITVLLIITSGVVLNENSLQHIVLVSGKHRLQRTRILVPNNLEVVIASTNELLRLKTLSHADKSDIDFLLQLKNGRQADVSQAARFFNLLQYKRCTSLKT